MELTVIIPVYNESENVEELYHRIRTELNKLNLLCEIIFIDDGSTDGTWELIEKLKESDEEMKGIKFRHNCGQTSAMVAGFNHASGEIIVTLDGDLQNDPSDIPRLLEKMNEGYDIVSGWRKNRKDHFSRVLPSIIANAAISVTTGVKLHDYGCTTKAYRAECIKNIDAYGEMHRFFPALASMTGARVAEMPVKHHPRKHGSSKYGFDRVLKVFSDILAMSLIVRFSSEPLKGFVFCAIPFIILTLSFGLLGGLAVALEWTEGKEAFFFIATALCGMGAMHLVTLGVLGELVVNTSDLTHTQLPETTRKKILINYDEDGTE